MCGILVLTGAEQAFPPRAPTHSAQAGPDDARLLGGQDRADRTRAAAGIIGLDERGASRSSHARACLQRREFTISRRSSSVFARRVSVRGASDAEILLQRRRPVGRGDSVRSSGFWAFVVYDKGATTS